MAIPAAFVTDGKYQISPEIYEESLSPDLDLNVFDITKEENHDGSSESHMKIIRERKFKYSDKLNLSQKMCQMANRAMETTCQSYRMPISEEFRPDDPRR